MADTSIDAPISLAFSLLADLAFKRGWVPIGFRRFELSPDLIVFVNGTNEPRRDIDPDGRDGIEIPPYHASVWCHGWPAGFISPYGGTLIVGVEDRLIAALQTALEATT